MSFENIPKEFRPFDLSEGPRNSLGMDVVGGPAAATRIDQRIVPQSALQTLGIGDTDETTTIVEGVGDAFLSGGNWAYDLFAQQERDFEYPVDGQFNASEWAVENKQKLGIPDEYMSSVGRTGSQKEAMALLEDVKVRQKRQARVQRMGVVGQFTSGMIAGFVDLDVVLSGGVALVGKAGLQTTRIGRAITGFGVAGTSGLAGTAASPEDDYADAALAAFLGAGFASIGGGGKVDGAADEFNVRVAAGIDELDAAVKARPQTSPPAENPTSSEPFRWTQEQIETGATDEARKPATFDPSEVEIVSEEAAGPAGSTVGAAQARGQDLDLEKPSRTVEGQILQARQYVTDNDLENLYDFDTGGAAVGTDLQKGVSETMRRAGDAIASIGLRTDFDRLMRSQSATAKMVAHSLTMDPSGRLSNPNSAIMVRDQLKNRYDMLWFQPYQDANNSYMRRNNIHALNLAERNRQTENFNKQVMLELENLRLGGSMSDKADPDVLRAATAINDTMKYDLATGKKYDVPGYRDIPDSEGYFPRRVTTSAIDSQMRRARGLGTNISEKSIRQMWSEYYAHMSGLSIDEARKVANMVMQRAKTNAEGSSSSLYELLSENGDEFLRGALKAQGIGDNDIDRVMASLIGKSDERGKQGFMKGRVDGDLRFVASNGLRVVDFVDTDIESIVTARSRSTTGRAALAEKGIRTKHDIETIKAAVQHEQRLAAPLDKPANVLEGVQDFIDRDAQVTNDYLDAIFEHFTGGGRITDKTAAFATRLKRMAVLSTMNGLGLTQFAESGAIMGAMGWRRFVQDLPANIRSDLSNPKSDLIQELQVLGTLVPEERLWNAKLAADMDESLHAKSEWAKYYDQLTGMGLKAQGVISGMNRIRYAQQKMSMMLTIDKTMRLVAGLDGGITPERARSIGLSDDLVTRLKNVQQHVSWDGDRVQMLNLDQWGDEALVDEFARTMQIATDQLVQKARLGESNIVFSGNGLASLLGQFLSYPLTAIQKQAARNAYIGDSEALLQLMYGFLFAGTVGMAKQVIAGRYENLEATEFARQGFTMANITGWVPLISDPLMRLIGADNLTFNPYGNVLRTPPAIDVVNRTLQSPAGLIGLLDGEISGADKANLRFLPLIGNWYGTTALLNRL